MSGSLSADERDARNGYLSWSHKIVARGSGGYLNAEDADYASAGFYLGS